MIYIVGKYQFNQAAGAVEFQPYALQTDAESARGFIGQIENSARSNPGVGSAGDDMSQAEFIPVEVESLKSGESALFMKTLGHLFYVTAVNEPGESIPAREFTAVQQPLNLYYGI